MEKLRVALIGAGQICRTVHIPGYRSLPETELVGISDPAPGCARRAAEEAGIPNWYTDHHQMLEQLHPDIVSVLTPNRFHCQLTLDALAAGCHVLCEKPPAMTPEEAEEMSRAADKAGRLLSYDFHLRHAAGVKAAKQLLQSGRLGEVYAADTAWLRRRGIPGWGCFTNRSMQGGGPLIDLGAHMLDLAFYLMDYPVLDYACATSSDRIGKSGGSGLMGSWDPAHFTVEDGLFGFLHFKNGASLHLQTAFALHMQPKDLRSLHLYGADGGLSLFPLTFHGFEDGQLTDTQFISPEEGDLHAAAIRNFVQACLGREPLLVTAQQGAYTQRAIGMLYASASSGRPVCAEESAVK